MNNAFLRTVPWLALASLLASLAPARDLPGRRQTVLAVSFDYQIEVPSEVSHITVPAGEIVSIRGDYTSVTAFESLQWYKDGQPLREEQGTRVDLGFILPSDAGTYAAKLTLRDGRTVMSQSLVLGVAPTERLVNLSVFHSLPGGQGEGLVAGFVIRGVAPKKMILRAVGPSLAQFGVGRVVQRPRLVIRDATGRAYENSYDYPIVDGPRDYETDLAESLSRVGAFRTTPGSADAVRLLPLVPGSYTVEITSLDATAGSVLLELYEVL